MRLCSLGGRGRQRARVRENQARARFPAGGLAAFALVSAAARLARLCTSAFNSSLMRVCQPGPPARNASTTSGSSRSVVMSFGASTGGRPRRTDAFSNFARHSGLDKSGASSSKARPEDFLFAAIGLPHADDPVGAFAARPNEDDHSPVQKSDCDETSLTIIFPVVLDGQCFADEDLIRSAHVETALKQCCLAFTLVKFDFHAIRNPGRCQ